MKNVILTLFIFSILLFAGCQSKPTQIANPASEKCIKDGFESIINNNDNGSIGYCQKTVNNVIVKCEEWAYFNNKCDMNRCDSCPMLSAPSPDFCKDGKLIIGEKNECGCSPPPKCEKNEETGKLLVHYPWTKGEKWTFVTGFHDENCLDFVNFDKQDSPVVAAANGEVFLSDYRFPDTFNTWENTGTRGINDMGNFVLLKHGENTYSIYMHFKHAEIPLVKNGELIKAGTIIGYTGNTGKSHGNHVHFCIVGVSFFPIPTFTAKPLDSWGFIENGGSNLLTQENKYESQNS